MCFLSFSALFVLLLYGLNNLCFYIFFEYKVNSKIFCVLIRVVFVEFSYQMYEKALFLVKGYKVSKIAFQIFLQRSIGTESNFVNSSFKYQFVQFNNSFMRKKSIFRKSFFVYLFFLVTPFLSSTTKAAANDRPNILWIYIEDLSPWMSCYGYNNNTPNIDKFAKEGVFFEKAFSPAPVCSATRSGVITGTMQTTFGLHQHRSSTLKEVGIYLPKKIKTIPELFKDNGYYSFCYSKEDYNFIYDRKDLYSGKGAGYYKGMLDMNKYDWDIIAKQSKPWFGQLQLMGGKSKATLANPTPVESVKQLPYYPNHPVINSLTARHYDEAKIVDQELEHVLQYLEDKGMLKNTIVFFFSDHGWNDAARHKQFCYEGGLHVPLIVKGFGKAAKFYPKKKRSDLVNLIDVSVSSLAMAGIKIPDYMEGIDLFDKKTKERDFVISARDRCDYTIDRIRTVRTKDYRYIKNFLTDRPYMQPQYRDHHPFFIALYESYEKGEMNEVQARFMKKERPMEELYDLRKDPYQINNLADNPKYAVELNRHREILNTWIEESGDQGELKESEPRLQAVYDKWKTKYVNKKKSEYKELNRLFFAPEYDFLKR